MDPQQPAKTKKLVLNGKQFDSEREVFAELERLAATRDWGKYFEPVFENDKAALKCRVCSPDARFSWSNISRLMGSHACTKSSNEDSQEAAAGKGGGSTGSTGVKRKLTQFLASATQREQFNDALAMFFITSETPFARVENPHFIKMCKIVGVNPPCRKTLSNTYVPRLHEKTKAVVEAELGTAATAAIGLQVAADGWKCVAHGGSCVTRLSGCT